MSTTTTNSYRTPFHILYKMSTTTTPTTTPATTFVYVNEPRQQCKLESPEEVSSKVKTFSVSLKSFTCRDKFLVLTLTMVPSKKPQITRTWVYKSGKQQRINRVTRRST